MLQGGTGLFGLAKIRKFLARQQEAVIHQFAGRKSGKQLLQSGLGVIRIPQPQIGAQDLVDRPVAQGRGDGRMGGGIGHNGAVIAPGGEKAVPGRGRIVLPGLRLTGPVPGIAGFKPGGGQIIGGAIQRELLYRELKICQAGGDLALEPIAPAASHKCLARLRTGGVDEELIKP